MIGYEIPIRVLFKYFYIHYYESGYKYPLPKSRVVLEKIKQHI